MDGVLTEKDYAALLALARAAYGLTPENYAEKILGEVERAFGWRLALMFSLDYGADLSVPEVSFIYSRSMNKKYLASCVKAYESERIMYDSMKRLRMSNGWSGVSYTQNLTGSRYDKSRFVALLKQMGFEHAAVLYITQQPVVCLCICKTEREGEFTERETQLLAQIRELLSCALGAVFSMHAGSGIDPAAAQSFGLTARETETARQMAEGKSNADIAAVLNISVNTVKVHIASIFRKTGAANRHEAITKLLFNTHN